MLHHYIRRHWGLEDPVFSRSPPEHGPSDGLERVLGRTLGVPLIQALAEVDALRAWIHAP